MSLRSESSTSTLRSDHDALVALTESVMTRVRAGIPEGVAEAIADLQARVAAHLDAEEREVIPGYTSYAPEDARALLGDHGKIRGALAELDVAVDLHLVRANALEAFLATLRAHAAREDTGLYRWAEEHR